MGPGGIESGGGDVLSAFETHLGQADISADIKNRCSTHKVGCLGMCSKDVLVDIFIDGNKTTYQQVNAGMVPRIVEEHIIQGEIQLGINFTAADDQPVFEGHRFWAPAINKIIQIGNG